MRTKLLFTLMCLTCTIASAASVYKWVDENGVTHYSDQPHENAQKVELKAPQTFSAPKTTSTPSRPTSPPKGPTDKAYTSCGMSEPTNDQVFLNTDTVSASTSVQPTMRPGDVIVVTMDGAPVPGVPANGGQFTISPVDRGEHTIQMVVKDPSGATMCSSTSVMFHVRQPSLQSPTNPVKKH
jgi:Domain of unknown function (DUF4124)